MHVPTLYQLLLFIVRKTKTFDMRIISLLSFALCIAFTSLGQIKATTEDGRQVLLNRDGTWQFANATSSNVSFDCNDLTTKSNNISASSNVLNLQGSGNQSIGVFLRENASGDLDMLLNVKGAGNCMQNGSAITLTFKDGTSSKASNDGDNNCDNRQKINLGKPTKDNALVNSLKNKELSSMLVYSKEGRVNVSLDSQQGKILLNTLWCLTSR